MTNCTFAETGTKNMCTQRGRDKPDNTTVIEDSNLYDKDVCAAW